LWSQLSFDYARTIEHEARRCVLRVCYRREENWVRERGEKKEDKRKRVWRRSVFRVSLV
jgi:hypothetical protein